uniref:DNA 5'-3' helicase n=1 Tax=viral metagenome TaxID=1070528 RepID=A0A6M3JYX9_9ZZZZ
MNSSEHYQIPPHALEIEMSLLGTMIIDPESAKIAIDSVEADVFYRVAHSTIFETITNLVEEDQGVDLALVAERLQKNGQLESIGGVTYLITIVGTGGIPSLVKDYIKAIKEKATSRKLIKLSYTVIEEAHSGGDIDDILDTLTTNIGYISSNKEKADNFRHIGSALHDTFETIEKISRGDNLFRGIQYGFKEIDRMTMGMHDSELILVAGRPSIGKSSYLIDIMRHLKVPVAFFSLEMSFDQLIFRLICQEARLDSHRIRSGYMADADWPKLTTAAGILSNLELYIDDTPGLSNRDIRRRAHKITEEKGVKVLLLDHLTLVNNPKKGATSREQEVSDIARGLNDLGRELDIPFVVACQLSRACELRGNDKRPRLSDLRSSGEIEQVADVVQFIYREEYYNPDTKTEQGVAEINIAKQRSGPTGTVKLAFCNKFTRFDNLAREESHNDHWEKS